MLKPSLELSRKRSNRKVLINEYSFKDSLKNLGLNKTYFIKTYGCQMNEHDSENIKAMLEQMSFKEVSMMSEADVIILNTCAIRENAHNKVFGYLGRIKHLRESKDVIVGLCGCMAQEEVVIDKIVDKYKWLDFVFGTHNLNELPNILEKAITNKTQQVEVLSYEGDITENIPVKRNSKYKAWINIMYGCDKFCTYCIVPYTRGKQRSRTKEYIINEINKLVMDGYKEITLLGQNVNAYGKDIYTDYGFSNLLEDVAKTGISRIRFVTSHPWDFNDEMIQKIKEYDNIMPYIHLPIQSGSDKVLKLMGRRYTSNDYLVLFNKLKKEIPNCSITTDIIVGFPNEEEIDFQQTLDIVNKCQFDSAFTFIFSPRKGTPADKLNDNISLEEKTTRLHRLNELINKYSKMNNDKYLNRIVPVLIEGFSDKNKNILMGYTDTMKLVNVKGSIDTIGTIQNVLIEEVKSWSMDGKIK